MQSLPASTKRPKSSMATFPDVLSVAESPLQAQAEEQQALTHVSN